MASTVRATSTHLPVVQTLKYEDLVTNKDLSNAIENAFGQAGIGLVAVANVPKLNALRTRLLPLGFEFAQLSDQIKCKYESEETLYSFGWSHGKENLQGQPDYSKGSYYNNPEYNNPVASESLIKKYPAFTHPNIWPKQEIPQLESAFMELGQCIVNVGKLLARQCDRLVERKCSDAEGQLYNIIKESRCCKARLLHYFPLPEYNEGADKIGPEEDFSTWCGWHNDHSALTGLVQAMYFDENGLVIDNPDPEAGLYVKSRSGELVKAAIPPDHLIFQIGETAQILSGGTLQATPHAVRGAQRAGISRETFAVFMQPEWDYTMSVPPSINPMVAIKETGYLPQGVPPISTRWSNGIDFDEFTTRTLAAYY